MTGDLIPLHQLLPSPESFTCSSSQPFSRLSPSYLLQQISSRKAAFCAQHHNLETTKNDCWEQYIIKVLLNATGVGPENPFNNCSAIETHLP